MCSECEEILNRKETEREIEKENQGAALTTDEKVNEAFQLTANWGRGGMTAQRKKLYAQALKKWGAIRQLEMLAEECAELIVKVHHWKRGRIVGELLLAEVADVEIMVEQMRVAFGDTQIDLHKREKLHRLNQRVNDA
jgi:hypothetical protein